MFDRRYQHDRRQQERRQSRLVLLQGDQPRAFYGNAMRESLRRACFAAQGTKSDLVYRITKGASHPANQLLAVADDVIPRLGGLVSASYLERTGLAFCGYVRSTTRETRPEKEARALRETWQDGGGAA
jgi:hypothetical protein